MSAAGDKLDVKFAYDVVFDAGNTNEHVGALWQQHPQPTAGSSTRVTDTAMLHHLSNRLASAGV